MRIVRSGTIVVAVMLWQGNASAQPTVTEPNALNLLTPCLSSVPLVGNGAGVNPVCWPTGSLGSIAHVVAGTGVNTALAVNIGSAGAPVLFNGLGGTPSSLTLTNATGLPFAGLVTASANTMLGNWTGSTGSISANAMPSCADTGSNHLNYVAGTGIICGTAATAAAAGTLTGTTLASNVVSSSLTSLGTIGSLTATTINAFTLGGNIAGGGKQIDNIVIGNISPQISTFTTSTSTTSVVSPLHIGGSASGSTLTLESTTGTGTTDAIAFQTGSQVYRGGFNTSGQMTIGPNVAPTTGPLLTINKNTTAPVPATSNNAVIQMIGPDAGTTQIVSDVFGTGTASFISLRTARGTQASFTASQSTDILGGFIGFTGATGANTFGATLGTAGGGYMGCIATENWSAGAQGTKCIFYTTPNTTASINQAMQINSSGGLSIGTTTDPLIGGLQVNGQTFMPNMASDTATTDSTVCTATTGGKLLKGTGTLGICLGTSSVRFKRDIVSMGAGLAEIVQLTPKNFFYKKGFGDDGKRQQYGLIAEDVVKVLPGITAPDKDGKPQAVDLLALVPVLVHAVQELKGDNDNLRKSIRALELAGKK